MPTTVRIKPEVITEHRLRIEMYGLEDEDIENTIRMKGWAWVLARKGWAYAGEPDFIFRQLRGWSSPCRTSPLRKTPLRSPYARWKRRPAPTRSSRKVAPSCVGPSRRRDS